MREKVLRDFFRGTVSGTELARDVAGATKQTSQVTSVTSVEDMDEEFVVTAEMAVRLCDAVLQGELPAHNLATIGFALMASDKFCWDSDTDDVLTNVISDWSCPEINYPLTLDNVARFRAWLLRAEPYPEKPQAAQTAGKIMSFREKKSVRPWWKRR